MMEALDLKYRPRKFNDVVGNSGVVNLLLRRSRAGTLAGRSMMFGGPKGCGKTSLARIVAMAIVCDGPKDGEPCGACNSCESVTLDVSPSMDEFDAATQGTVDRIRSILEDLEYGSMDGKTRVVILDEAQRLSKAAQDALLKSVEDRRFVVILCTTEPHKIGEAIRSRLEEYPVSPPPEQDVITRLELVCKSETISYELEALSIVARHNKCCPRTSLTSLDTLRTIGGASVTNVQDLFRYGSMGTLVDALSRVDSDPSTAFDSLDGLFSHEGASWVRDNMIAAISSALRVAVGAKPTYPINSSFFPVRGLRWGDLARALGILDRPTPHDIESAIISTGTADVISTPSTPVPAPVPRSIPAPSAMYVPAPEPVAVPDITKVVVDVPSPQLVSVPVAPVVKSVSKPAPAPKKMLEVDGVKFTHDEKLTSLDHKIEPGGVRPPSIAPLVAGVELDKSKIPLPEKEFARDFVQRMKG